MEEAGGAIKLVLPRAYGWVVLNVPLNWMILMWQALQVGKARKKYEIKYPTLYESKEHSMFNCIQRAHQNSLEWNPGFLALLLLGGLTCPYIAAISGLVFNAGRVAYAKGYYAGSPHEGLWGLYGIMVLFGCTVYTGYRLLTS